MDINALAKSHPEEDIQTHTDYLLGNLELLKQLYPNLFVGWDMLYELLRLACIYHDLGKLNPRFQNCIKKRIPYSNGIPHGLLSLAFIDYKWLRKEKGFKNDDLRLLFQAVAYHHDRKMPYNNNDIETEFYKLHLPYNHFKYDKLPSDFVAEEINDRYFTVGERFNKRDGNLFFKFIILEGLLNRLDYAASAHIPVEHPHDFLEDAMDSLMIRWQQKQPGIQWKELQIYAKLNANKNIIAIAQTGMGKTEAGLLWIGNAKGFFTLPLKSAINAIYDRISDNVILDQKEEKIGMLHSDTYIKYLERSEQEQKKMEEEGVEKDGISSDLYFTRTKQLSLPLTICTLDQLFGFVFLYRGFEYKLATLSYAKIVIDEVQMYSADLIAYLVLGLRYIYTMGGQFAILTATLPTFFMDLLKEFKIPFEPPRVFIDDRIRHGVKVIEQEINARDIVELSRKYGGKKILVICNTVKSAVNLYQQLEWDEDNRQVNMVIPSIFDEMDDENEDKQGIYLLHSYFTKSDRAKKEKHILNMGRKESAESGIWIATQIVEVSLDIDFDLLFTELSDLNGFFQRMGRCYRNRELDIPYNCFVFTGGGKLCSGVGVFIDKKIHQLSKEALVEIDGIISEDQKVTMVAELYTKEKLPEYYDYIKETIVYVDSHSPYEIDKKKADEKFRNIDTVSVIPRKVYQTRNFEIGQAIEVLQKEYNGKEMDRNEVKQLRTKAREVIVDHTVNISKYWASEIEIEVIKINDYEQIRIAESDYNSQVGIIKPALKNKNKDMDFSSHSF